jgi:dihydrofolate reductase
MRKVTVFNHISLDGYFTDARGDMSWAYAGADDPEFRAFTEGNASGSDAALVFGRVTYEMMAGFWPSRAAQESMPAVAEAMNRLPKIVFSRTLAEASWSNTRLVKDDPVAEIRALKETTGPDMVVMGSGTIVARLAAAGLVDLLQLVINPIALGAGRTLFEGVSRPIALRLTSSRTFANGKAVMSYEPLRGVD